jgi:hypothetical protein
MKRHATPVIAAILLLLPVLYVGSYLAIMMTEPDPFRAYFQVSKTYPGYVQSFFWPLELIDRQVRSKAWQVDVPPSVRDQLGTTP